MDRLNLVSVQGRLTRGRVSIFSVTDFMRIFRILPKTARSFLSYHSREGGQFIRVRQGIYVAKFNPPTKFEAANYLFRPSYVSFETALSYYGIIPETIYTITSATPKASKEFTFLGQSYRYYKIKKKLLFGHRPIKIGNKLILMAEREKALLDYLYLRLLKKQPFSERLDLKSIDKKRLGKYFNFFKRSIRKNKGLIKLMKEIGL